jgi:hypothetical protein
MTTSATVEAHGDWSRASPCSLSLESHAAEGYTQALWRLGSRVAQANLRRRSSLGDRAAGRNAGWAPEPSLAVERYNPRCIAWPAAGLLDCFGCARMAVGVPSSQGGLGTRTRMGGTSRARRR